ncbi:hypothetical protein [Rugamonas aquatica]|nr:hypothetical protein [Rugamonas aquatica]
MADHRLTPLKKSDLQFRYTPGVTEGDDPSKRNAPDSALLNRSEWYEVLYFVNKFANENTSSGSDTGLVAKKAERLIHRYLPGNQRSHAHVTTWLLNNWSTHGDAPIT